MIISKVRNIYDKSYKDVTIKEELKNLTISFFKKKGKRYEQRREKNKF